MKEKEKNIPIRYINPSDLWRQINNPSASSSYHKLRLNKSWKRKSWTGRIKKYI